MESFPTTKTRAKARLLARAKGERTARVKLVGTPAKVLNEIMAGDRSRPSTVKEASNVAIAMQGLPDASQPMDDMLTLLRSAFEVLADAQAIALMSDAYHAAGRLDEVYFGGPEFT